MYQRVFHWVRTAYLDAPSRWLTVASVARACHVEAAVCAQVLDDLVRAKFLVRTAGGSYSRPPAGDALLNRTGARQARGARP